MKEELVTQLKDFFSRIGKKKAVIGVSGGIDSAVCLTLATEALGPGNVTALFLPEEALTSSASRQDALLLTKNLGVPLHIVPIDAFIHQAGAFPWTPNHLARINIKPRTRMLILYHFANTHDAIVIGTSNKSEILLGYGTKHGDCAADVLPLGDLYKTEVFELAQELGIPESIISKRPSAELFPGQTDEEEMGILYATADRILQNHLEIIQNHQESGKDKEDGMDKEEKKNKEDGRNKEELQKLFPEKDVEIVLSRLQQHEHKRVPVPILKLSRQEKMEKKTGLFIGRFQPFHLGHLDAVQQITKECQHIIVAVGSAQYSNTIDNPFSFEQRQEIISKVLTRILARRGRGSGNDREGDIRFDIIPVEDIHDDNAWVEHLRKTVPPFEIAYTSNPLVEKLFLEKGITVKRLSFNVAISGEEIRDLAVQGLRQWKGLVPEETIPFMERHYPNPYFQNH